MLDVKFEIEKELPPLRRRVREAQEMEPLLDALSRGEVISVPAASPEEGARIGTRVRYAAKRRGFALTQRFDPARRKLYLQKT